MIWIILITFLLAGLAEGIMDWLQFRLPLKIQHKWIYHKFWDPRVSWKNKWKGVWKNPKTKTVYLDSLTEENQKERFPLSSTVLVFLTDGWHLMKWCRNRFTDTGIILSLIQLDAPILPSIIFVIGCRLVYGIGFWLTFKKLL